MEIDASVYAMGTILVKGGNLVCYRFEIFQGVVLDYPL